MCKFICVRLIFLLCCSFLTILMISLCHFLDYLTIYEDQPSASLCIILLVFLRFVLSCKHLGCFGAFYVANAFNTTIFFLITFWKATEFCTAHLIISSWFNYINLVTGIFSHALDVSFQLRYRHYSTKISLSNSSVGCWTIIWRMKYYYLEVNRKNSH